jgi:SAM-dependent methyltransferase
MTARARAVERERTTPAPPEWELVGRAGNRAAIHPAGASGDAAYWRSGEWDADRIGGILPPDRYPTIVDFGCADGRVTRALVARGYRTVIGVDAARSMVDRLSVNVPAAIAVRSDGIDLVDALRRAGGPPRANAVVSISTFVHMTHEGGERVLAGLARAVELGGILAVQIPVYDEARTPRDWTDVGVWTRSQLEDACTAAGLSPWQLWTNPGRFTFEEPGPHHRALQILRRP